MADRAYLSIGEVLSLLKEEFPDITISKIRFLESQGLLDPERTPSGYRKFYESDVERLRWILRQQRENFLPLKVIKGRLATAAEPEEEPTGHPAAEAAVATPLRRTRSTSPVRPTPVFDDDDQVAAARALAADGSGASMAIEELAAASGVRVNEIQELERFGLLAGRSLAGTVYYDEEALLVARLASSFAEYGVQARHLRMYRTAAEREAGFIEQVVLPLMKQRHPDARRQAVERTEDLTRLGQRLRGAILAQLLRRYVEGPS
jgi:DNA-binding transcriptional MerR regulator